VLCGQIILALIFSSFLVFFRLSFGWLIALLLPLETLILGFRFFQIGSLINDSKNRYELICSVVSSYYIDPISRIIFYLFLIISLVFDPIPITVSLAPLIVAAVLIIAKKVAEDNLVNPLVRYNLIGGRRVIREIVYVAYKSVCVSLDLESRAKNRWIYQFELYGNHVAFLDCICYIAWIMPLPISGLAS